jgi:hypothetical protein
MTEALARAPAIAPRPAPVTLSKSKPRGAYGWFLRHKQSPASTKFGRYGSYFAVVWAIDVGSGARDLPIRKLSYEQFV